MNHVVFHQVKAECGAYSRDNNRPVGVNKAYLTHDDVVRDTCYRTVEHQGVGNQAAHRGASGELILCQRISGHGAEDNRTGCAQEGDEECVEYVPAEGNPAVADDLEQIAEVVKRRVHNIEPGREQEHFVQGLERVDYDQPQRQHREQTEGSEEDRQSDIHAKRTVTAGNSAMIQIFFKLFYRIKHKLLTHPSKRLLYDNVGENHDEEQYNRNCGGITHLVTHSAVVIKVGQNCVTRIVYGGEACKLSGYTRYRQRACDLHNRTEHQLRLHCGKGYVPKLLPTVLDTVDGTGLIHSLVNRLKTGYEGQERYAQAQPQLNYDKDGHDVLCCFKPEYGAVDDAPVQEPRVYVTVHIGAEEQLPDNERVTRNRGCVEHQSQKRTRAGRKLVDEPGENEAHQIAYGARHNGEQHGVLHCDQEYVIVNNEVYVVVQPDEIGNLKHVEVRRTKNDRYDNRNSCEANEDKGEGEDHKVFLLVKSPRVRPFHGLKLLLRLFYCCFLTHLPHSLLHNIQNLQ